MSKEKSSKGKIISVSELNKKKNELDQSVTLDWYGTELIIKKCIKLNEMVAFVSSTVEYCFSGVNGEFMPELRDFAIRMNIIRYFSNARLPDSARSAYEIIYMTDIIDKILENANRVQIEDIVDAIDRKIEYLSDVRRVEESNRVDEALRSVQSVVDMLSDVMGGMKREDMDKIMSAVVNNKIDEEKLMRAYLDDKDVGRDADGGTISVPAEE